MNLICVTCGEPWDMDYVLHDAPEEFKRKDGVIRQCPCCKNNKPKLSNDEKFRLEAVSCLGEILGDDIDGFVSSLEDFGLT